MNVVKHECGKFCPWTNSGYLFFVVIEPFQDMWLPGNSEIAVYRLAADSFELERRHAEFAKVLVKEGAKWEYPREQLEALF